MRSASLLAITPAPPACGGRTPAPARPCSCERTPATAAVPSSTPTLAARALGVLTVQLSPGSAPRPPVSYVFSSRTAQGDFVVVQIEGEDSDPPASPCPRQRRKEQHQVEPERTPRLGERARHCDHLIDEPVISTLLKIALVGVGAGHPHADGHRRRHGPSVAAGRPVRPTSILSSPHTGTLICGRRGWPHVVARLPRPGPPAHRSTVHREPSGATVPRIVIRLVESPDRAGWRLAPSRS